LYLCEQAALGDCEGQRAEITAARIALALGAIRGRDSSDSLKVTHEDLQVAVQLAVVPRMRRDPISAEMSEGDEEIVDDSPLDCNSPSESQSQQRRQQQPVDNGHPGEGQDEPVNTEESSVENSSNDRPEGDSVDNSQEEGGDGPLMPPISFVVEAVSAPVSYNLVKFRGQQRWGKGGKSGVLFSRDRGKYIRSVLPREGAPFRLAVDATLREAAKHQVCCYRRYSLVYIIAI
jgi:hypothetical protein